MNGGGGEAKGMLVRQLSRSCSTLGDSEEEEEEEEEGCGMKLAEGYLGPMIPLKEQLERDKDDLSLRRWKEQLLGAVDLDNFAERVEPEVRLVSLSVISEGRDDIEIPLPITPDSRNCVFTLKEGCTYRLKFSFSVLHNLVSGLTYLNTVWKDGVRVEQTRSMLGTFAPQLEPCTHITDEEATPSGMLARGAYSARMKFVDDDRRCYLDMEYGFHIRKEWV